MAAVVCTFERTPTTILYRYIVSTSYTRFSSRTTYGWLLLAADAYVGKQQQNNNKKGEEKKELSRTPGTAAVRQRLAVLADLYGTISFIVIKKRKPKVPNIIIIYISARSFAREIWVVSLSHLRKYTTYRSMCETGQYGPDA